MADDDQGEGQHGGAAPHGSFLKRKVGPLPVWVWMALVLLVLLGLTLWQKNKAAAPTDTSTTPAADQTPPWIIQNYITGTGGGTQGTPPPTPPAGGRPGGPVATPGGGGGTSPIQSPTPTPPPLPQGQWVTVTKYTTKNPLWSSTLSGIASHLGLGSNWQAIWNDPQNAQLKSRRKDPKYIQPGDRVYVPAK